ncbi:MAG: allophanate hydrolase subunit 1 [Acidimicrobiia bacterium]|nr:allophanate hydrolase subunit 1 [Acidimicrobiia bacterium]
MRVRPYGPEAWLIDEVDDPVAWARGVRTMGVVGIDEVVAAEHTVLVRCERSRLGAVAELLSDIVPEPVEIAAEPVVIPVRYAGPDLADVAERTGLSVPQVIERHTAVEYVARFCGFAPGFAYLGGLDPRLELPRRATPRTRVPMGSVAIAAHYSAVYPAPSPGGWHLLGTTDEVLWDPAADPPSRIVPGTTVRFTDTAV